MLERTSQASVFGALTGVFSSLSNRSVTKQDYANSNRFSHPFYSESLNELFSSSDQEHSQENNLLTFCTKLQILKFVVCFSAALQLLSWVVR